MCKTDVSFEVSSDVWGRRRCDAHRCYSWRSTSPIANDKRVVSAKESLQNGERWKSPLSAPKSKSTEQKTKKTEETRKFLRFIHRVQ